MIGKRTNVQAGRTYADPSTDILGSKLSAHPEEPSCGVLAGVAVFKR